MGSGIPGAFENTNKIRSLVNLAELSRRSPYCKLVNLIQNEADQIAAQKMSKETMAANG